MNSLAAGWPSRAHVAAGTLAAACAQAGALLAPRRSDHGASLRSWHLHADGRRGGSSPRARETARPGGGCGSSSGRYRLLRHGRRGSGAVLARQPASTRNRAAHGGRDAEPRRLVISSDFYAVYQSARADALVNLYAGAHPEVFRACQRREPAQLRTGRQRGWSNQDLTRARAVHHRLGRTRPPRRGNPPRPPLGWARPAQPGRGDRRHRRGPPLSDDHHRTAGSAKEGPRHTGPRIRLIAHRAHALFGLYNTAEQRAHLYRAFSTRTLPLTTSPHPSLPLPTLTYLPPVSASHTTARPCLRTQDRCTPPPSSPLRVARPSACRSLA